MIYERLKRFCLLTRSRRGEVVSQALQEFLDSKVQHTTSSAKSPEEFRGDVLAKVDQVQHELLLYMSDNDNTTGIIPVPDFEGVVRKAVGKDLRTVRKYTYRILPPLGYIDVNEPKVIRVLPKWVSTLQPREIAP